MLQLPKVIAHRGASAYAPENTLAAFREAKARGAAWVELDVKLAADGVPIVLHDDSLKRTTGVDRLAAETPSAEMPAEVPTFEATIALLSELGLGCNAEIKPNPGQEAETARATVETLRRCWPVHLPQPFLSSFKDASLAAARAAAPEYPFALLIDPVGDDALDRARRLGAVGISIDGRTAAVPRAVAIKQAGLLLSLYTINDPAVARAWLAMGADCIITDVPDTILRIL